MESGQEYKLMKTWIKLHCYQRHIH